MRKITRDAVDAFCAGRAYASGNTTVLAPAGTDPAVLALHGNPIAKRYPDGRLFVRTAGWDSVTTKERLNGLPGVSVYHAKRELYLNGRQWTGHADWTEVGAAPCGELAAACGSDVGPSWQPLGDADTSQT